MNSIQNSLKKHNLTFENVKCSSQKKKKNMKHNHKCFSALSKKILQRKGEESREISDQYSTSIANSLAMHGKILHKFSNIILCLF